jgi:hypothetical protein
MKNAPAEPGQDDEAESTKDRPSSTPLDIEYQDRDVDPLAAWLLRADVRYDLLRLGEIDLDSVFDPQFIADFLEATGACPCRNASVEYFSQMLRWDREQRLRRWRQSRP